MSEDDPNLRSRIVRCKILRRRIFGVASGGVTERIGASDRQQRDYPTRIRHDDGFDWTAAWVNFEVRFKSDEVTDYWVFVAYIMEYHDAGAGDAQEPMSAFAVDSLTPPNGLRVRIFILTFLPGIIKA